MLELTLPHTLEPVTGSVVEATTPLSLRYADVPDGATLRLTVNGTVVRELSLTGSGRLELSLPDTTRWGVLELRAPDGTMLAVTNPVFTPKFVTATPAAAAP